MARATVEGSVGSQTGRRKLSEFSFELATPADDPAIRRLLAAQPVPGQITVTYEREPDYFLACRTMGRFCQVLVARHQPSGEVVAVASRTTCPRFINGQVEEVGYIGQLRVAEQFQGHWIVSNGFRFFRQLHADRRVRGYLTTIIEGNNQAQGVLVDRPRRHFPVYRQVDRLCTLALILHKPFPGWGRRWRSAAYELGRGSAADLRAILTFLRQYGPAKQFFPVYHEADFGNDSTTLGFQVEDFVIARQNGRMIGVMGLWDQSSYKQTVVQNYGNSLRWFRPFYNLGARLSRAQPLPVPGQPIHFAYASFICIAENDPVVFQELLAYLYHLAAEQGYAYLMVGLAERDPLLAAARRYAHIPYYSRLYTVCWPGEEKFHQQLDQRVPYVEIATL